jgi:hypothetical protein
MKTGIKEHLYSAVDFFKKIRFVKKQIKGSSAANSIQPDTLIYTYYPQTWRDELNGDYVLHQIANYSADYNKKAAYALFFFDYYGLKGINLRKNWDPLFFRSFPSLYEIIRFHVELVFAFPQIKKVRLKNNKIDFLNDDVLFFELNNVLKHKREYLFNYLWFTNYFKRFGKPVKVFFQDEFYISGRVISAAAKNAGNANITTYGVQHGIIYEAHTVCSITNDEIDQVNEPDGIPMPDKFIVWGNYFKELFLKNNSKESAYVIAAGNPNYTRLQLNFENRSASGPLKLLWCTTNKIDIINQYKNIISGFLDKDKNTLIAVRCHPQLNYISFIKDELTSAEHKTRLVYSERKNIHEDMNDSDVILASSGSTVFLDAMVCKKPILKLVNEDYYMGDLGENEMIKVHTHSDLLREVQNLSSKPGYKVDYWDLLKTDSSEWNKLFEYAN